MPSCCANPPNGPPEMSRAARDWAWMVPDLSPSTRLVLLALAEHVHDGVTCFPGQARLAELCGVSDRQVRNLLHELQGRGLIAIEHRPGQGGGRKSNVYRLQMGYRQPAAAGVEGQSEPGFWNALSECRGAIGNPVQGNRQSASAGPEGQPALQFRNPVTGCPEATGNPAQGNRKSATGNRNRASDETEEGTGRKKRRDSPPYPPAGGDLAGEHDDCLLGPPGGPTGEVGERSPTPAATALPQPVSTGSDRLVGTTGKRGATEVPAPAAAQPRTVVAIESAAVREGNGGRAAGRQRQAQSAQPSTGPPRDRQGSRPRTNATRGTASETDRRSAAKDYTVGATRDENLPDWASSWRGRAHVAE